MRGRLLALARLIAVAIVLALVPTITASAVQPDASDGPYSGYESKVYARKASWLCRPDRRDPCDRSLDTTVVRDDGTTKIQRFQRAKRPKIDCFYVYPTVSDDPTTNSDLVPDPDLEAFTVRNQAARLQSVCRLYAPMYRQMTLASLLNAQGIGPPPSDAVPRERAGQIAYDSVLDAWKQYVANDNRGRGVVLVGHSQGAAILNQLIQREIDGRRALRRRLVSALLLGWPVAVPPGEDVGGDFDRIPLCRAKDDLGCVITYESFRPTSPPPADGVFGRTELGPAGCTNPASLDGGSGTLRPYFLTDRTNDGLLTLLGLTGNPPPWLDPAAGTVTTPWVTLPDLVDAQCVEENGLGYLSVTVRGDPQSPRVDDIGGDLPLGFGLHVVDANIAMGDLERIVRQQARTYRAR